MAEVKEILLTELFRVKQTLTGKGEYFLVESDYKNIYF